MPPNMIYSETSAASTFGTDSRHLILQELLNIDMKSLLLHYIDMKSLHYNFISYLEGQGSY